MKLEYHRWWRREARASIRLTRAEVRELLKEIASLQCLSRPIGLEKALALLRRVVGTGEATPRLKELLDFGALKVPCDFAESAGKAASSGASTGQKSIT